MPSLLTGFEYDIFISYRQKDNKGDRWVSEFVEALKTELESTFKEEISVYFDINPHDGLLETHDVNASLKDKLKCLIFIPIISRTYCDPKSFAWEHEFKAFVGQASTDQFGLKVKLPNGNVASRVLPIQIHEITPDDKAHIEKELGGILRAIEFIYKEPGVNKPLTTLDDEKINLNKTKYRIQINKLAYAIDELIQSITGQQTNPVERKLQYDKSLPGVNDKGITKVLSDTTAISRGSRKWLMIMLSAVLCIVVAFVLFKSIESSKKTKDFTRVEKSIAVLPFTNLSNDPEQGYLSEGMREEILNHLFKIGGLNISSSSSTMRFRESKFSIREIARDLGVSYVLEGNVRKSGNQIRVIVRLINGKNEELVWTEDYDREMTAFNILEIQSDVAMQVAENLKVIINPEVKKRIRSHATENTEAYTLYLQAVYGDSYENRMQLLQKAVLLDPGFADAYAIMAYSLMWVTNDSLSREQRLEKVEPLLNKALQSDSNSIQAHLAYSELKLYFYWDFEAVEKEIQIFKQLNPSNTEESFSIMQCLWALGRNKEAFEMAKDCFNNFDKMVEAKWTFMAEAYQNLGEQEKALATIETALNLFPDNSFVHTHALSIYILTARYDEAIGLFEKNNLGKELNDIDYRSLSSAGIAYFKTGNKSKATSILNELLSRNRNFYGAAHVYIGMGENDKAVQCLEKAYNERETDMALLKTDSYFKPLHGDPRFENLLLKIGFKK